MCSVASSTARRMSSRSTTAPASRSTELQLKPPSSGRSPRKNAHTPAAPGSVSPPSAVTPSRSWHPALTITSPDVAVPPAPPRPTISLPSASSSDLSTLFSLPSGRTTYTTPGVGPAEHSDSKAATSDTVETNVNRSLAPSLNNSKSVVAGTLASAEGSNQPALTPALPPITIHSLSAGSELSLAPCVAARSTGCHCTLYIQCFSSGSAPLLSLSPATWSGDTIGSQPYCSRAYSAGTP